MEQPEHHTSTRGVMNVLLIDADAERRNARADALRDRGYTVVAVARIADIERWPCGDIVVTEARWFSRWWTSVGAVHVIVLADTPTDGEEARRRGASSWLPATCSAAALLAVLPTPSAGAPEEQDGAFAEALQRVRGEFLEMPGLQLTPAQAARLWSFDSGLCAAVLAALVERRFLVRTKHDSFVRS